MNGVSTLRHSAYLRAVAARRRLNLRLFPYDTWLHFSLTEACNLQCDYCISDTPGFSAPKRFGGKSEPLRVEAMMKTLESTGRRFKIALTGGGEPFLHPNVIELCAEITNRHYLGIHSNLTVSKRIEAFAKTIAPHRVLFVNGSLHYEELRKKKFLDRYAESFYLLTQRGFPVSSRAVAHPDLLEHVNEIRCEFSKRHIPIAFGPFVGNHSGKSYPAAYTADEIRTFELRYERGIHYPKDRVCNAGYNVSFVRPDGTVQACNEVRAKLGNVFSGITFNDDLINCNEPTCTCPYFAHDKQLFQLARRASSPEVNALGQSLTYFRRSQRSSLIRGTSFVVEAIRTARLKTGRIAERSNSAEHDK